MSDEIDRNLPFSQRYGYEDLPSQMQLEELSEDLRREIWDCIREILLRYRSYEGIGYYFDNNGTRFVERTIGAFLKQPKNRVNTRYNDVFDLIEEIITKNKFNKVLDFLEIILNDSDPSDSDPSDSDREDLAALFEKHSAAYYLDLSMPPYRVFPRTSKEESEATSQSIVVIKEAEFEAALSHLRQASTHLRDKQYADSVADSMNAVESVARSIVPDAKTLGAALILLKDKGLIKHPALIEGFHKLYGYTSDKQGIRHALIDRDAANVGEAEALFFFNACAAFAGYLSNKKILLEQHP